MTEAALDELDGGLVILSESLRSIECLLGIF